MALLLICLQIKICNTDKTKLLVSIQLLGEQIVAQVMIVYIPAGFAWHVSKICGQLS